MSLKKLLSLRKRLAFRLTLWYAGIFTISSCVAFFLFYALISSVIHERTDQELLNEASQFSTVLATGGLEGVERFAVLEVRAQDYPGCGLRYVASAQLHGGHFATEEVGGKSGHPAEALVRACLAAVR